MTAGCDRIKLMALQVNMSAGSNAIKRLHIGRLILKIGDLCAAGTILLDELLQAPICLGYPRILFLWAIPGHFFHYFRSFSNKQFNLCNNLM